MGDTVLRLCLISALLAGCGKVNDKAPPADAGIDADLSGDATVVTQVALVGGKIGDRVGNIDIVSTLPNNMVLATAKTDANGSGTIRVYPGGSVTAIYPHPPTTDMGTDLITWVGVKPGDTLTFGARSFANSNQASQDLGTQIYSWPAIATGVSSYRVFTPCAVFGLFAPSAATSVNGDEFTTCHQDPMTVLYMALDSSGAVVNFGVRSNVTFAKGATVALGSWSAPAMGSINITGLPTEITSLSGTFRVAADTTAGLGVFSQYNGTPTGGAFTAGFKMAAFGARTVGAVNFNRSGFSTMQLLDSFSANTLTQTVAAPPLPAWAQGNTITSSALRKATWFLVPEASSTYDGQILYLEWFHTVSGTTHPSEWNIILPPSQTEIDWPALPPPLSDHLPLPEDFTFGFTTAFDISSVTSYDMVRTLPSANIMCLGCAVSAGDFQRVVMTQF